MIFGSFAVGSNNRLTSDGTFNYTYDNEGNRLTKTRISSATVDDYKTEYTWDHRNRLTSVVLKNNSNAKKKDLLYDYDHLNRLVRRKADNDGNGTIDQTDVYAHDGYQIALQFSAASSANLTAASLVKRYLWGVNQDELLADETVAGGVLWAATDHLGSVRDLLRLSGSTTSVANHLTYNAFGVLVSKSSATATDNTMFAYTGKWTDAVSQLQWNINRWYDAPAGKWISEDPIGFAAGDVNLYRYVHNGVTLFFDGFGLYEKCTIKVHVGHGARDAVEFADNAKNEGADGSKGFGKVAAIACNVNGSGADINAHLRSLKYNVVSSTPRLPEQVATYHLTESSTLWMQLLASQRSHGENAYTKPTPVGAMMQNHVDLLWPDETKFSDSSAKIQRKAYNDAASTVFKAFVQALYVDGRDMAGTSTCCGISEITIQFNAHGVISRASFIKGVWNKKEGEFNGWAVAGSGVTYYHMNEGGGFSVNMIRIKVDNHNNGPGGYIPSPELTHATWT